MKIVSFVSLLSILILSYHFTNLLVLYFYRRYKLQKVHGQEFTFPYSGSCPRNRCGHGVHKLIQAICGDDRVGGKPYWNKIGFVQVL